MPHFSPSKDFATSASARSHHSSSASSHPASFFFRRRTGKLNWSHLSSVSLAHIVAHVDVDALQQHVDAITYADITEADLAHATDPQILHLIRLAQLTIEYLLNAQNYLIKQAKRRDRLVLEVKAEVERCREQLAQRDEEIARLKQDNKYHKRLLKALESSHLSPSKAAPAYGGLSAASAVGAELSVYTCEYCRASFVSEVYLQGHIGRRHPDARNRRGGPGKGGRDGSEDDEREKERERERRMRDKIEEEERPKRELQRMRDELEAERKRMKEEMEREKAELLKASEREREKQQAEWQQQQRERKQQQEDEEKEQVESRQPHHTNSRPAPIIVTPPPPQQQPTALAAEMERVAAEMAALKEWRDGVMRGDIAISPQPHSGGTQATQQQQRPMQSTPAPSLSPTSPVPSPSAASQRSQPQQRQPRLTSSHRLKRFSSFSHFPQLLSHFQHNENDLVRAATGLEAAMGGWAEGEAERAEEEVRGAGYEREAAGVEGEVERLMDGFVDEALEERWAAVLDKEKELEARRRQREERAKERDVAARRSMDRVTAERAALEQQHSDRQHASVMDSMEREREMQRVEHERQLMAAQQAQLVAAEQLVQHQQLLAQQAAQLGLYSQPTPPQPIIQQPITQPQQPSMDEQRFLLEKQNALRNAQQQQQLPTVAQSAAIANAAAAVTAQRRGAVPPSYNAVEAISDVDSEDDSPAPAQRPQQWKAAEEQKQPYGGGGMLAPPTAQHGPRIHDDSDGVESISLSQPVSPIPHLDDSTSEQPQQQRPAAVSLAPAKQPMQLSAVRRTGGGFMLPAVTAKTMGGGAGFASGPRPNASALKPIEQTRAAVRDLSAELDLEEEEF